MQVGATTRTVVSGDGGRAGAENTAVVEREPDEVRELLMAAYWTARNRDRQPEAAAPLVAAGFVRSHDARGD